MKLLIDSANIKSIKHLIKYFPIDGVTTNPSILKKEGQDPYTILRKIKSIIFDRDLHVQAISKSSKDMVDEAIRITNKLGHDTFVKIPVNEEGLLAIKILSQKEIKTTGTAVYSTEQAYLAGKAGANYIAPYLNRMQNLYGNGIETISKIDTIFKQNNMCTKILAASFKNKKQLMDVAEIGVDAATAPADIIKSMLDNANVDAAIDKFTQDFYDLCGQAKKM